MKKTAWGPIWQVTVEYRPGFGTKTTEVDTIAASSNISAMAIDPDTLEEAVRIEAVKLLHSIKFKAIMEGVDLG